jgi:Domain of unknown function (DUF4872)/Butirosin biosynthesis protein H, N-terminal
MNFQHRHAAHCESGVVSSLLTHYGLPISEAMAFGLASAIAFAYIPIVKIANMPLIAYRILPKQIISGAAKRLGVKFEIRKYSDEAKATKELDGLLADGMPVGLQTSVFYLPYFPHDMRFHFNAHNIIVYGKEDGEYLVSDPVFDTTMRSDEAGLTKARFAKGVFEPKGFLYYPAHIPQNIDMEKAITKSIKKTVRRMSGSPFFPIVGIRGMRYLANKIEKLDLTDKRYTKNFLAHIIRMQEEIGTGGGGFRFMYAAFLQEASYLHSKPEILKNASIKMTAAGDKLREFALECAKACKKDGEISLTKIAGLLREAATIEEEAYRILSQIK